MRTFTTGAVLVAAVLVLAMPAATAPSNKDDLKDELHFLAQSKKTYTGGQKAARMRNMEVVGRNNLGGRGFNADVWVHEGTPTSATGGFTDWANGSKTRFCPSPPKNGVAVVDATDPSDPVVVSRLVNPTGTSAEDVTVFEARFDRSPAATSRRSASRSAAARGSTRASRAGSCSSTSRTRQALSSWASQHGLLHAAFTSSSSGIGTTSGGRSSTRPCRRASTRRRARRAGSATCRDAATSGSST